MPGQEFFRVRCGLDFKVSKQANLSVDPAWIGASADIMLLVLWARRFGEGAWS